MTGEFFRETLARDSYIGRLMQRSLGLFVFLFAVVGMILLLRWTNPEMMGGSERWLHVIYGLMWLALIGTSARIQRLDASTAVKYAVIWLAIILGLVLFYDAMKSLP